MADIVISYAGENEATARMLAEALAKNGYEVWLAKGGSDAANADAVTEKVVGAKAVVVIWSSAAAASEWVRAEANIARGMKKLVQASADGSPPPVPFDAAQVSSVSTWLGDDAHPGWETIKTALAGLAGPPPMAAPDPDPVPTPAAEPEALSDPKPSAPPAAPPPPASSANATPRKGPNSALIVIIVVVIIAVLAAAAWFWQRSRQPAAPPPPVEQVEAPQPAPAVPAPSPTTTPPAAAVENETFDRQAVLSSDGPAVLRSGPSTISFTVGRIEPGEMFSTYQQSGDWWRVRTASGATGYLMSANIAMREPGAAPAATPTERAERTPAQRAERRRPRGPRIRKENSEVMVAYCEGAGRGTPQCRRFRQSY